jgi:uncharacterized membrane protein
MIDVVVVTFKADRERAAAVLNELRGNAEPWTARLHGSTAVYRDHAGKLAIDESFEATKGNDAIAGGFTGSLVGLLLAVMALPVTVAAGPLVAGGALVAGALGGEVIGSHHRAAHADADAKWWRDEVGVSAALAQQIESELGAGDSAIVCLLRDPDPELASRFARFGGAARTIPLTAEQAAKVDARLPV